MIDPTPWAGISSDRVVAVVGNLDTGRVQVGSGFLVADGTVITARHCLMDKKTHRSARSLRVVRRSDGIESSARVLCCALDIAVLVKEPDVRWGWSATLNSLTFGRVDATHSGELLGCEAMGFPLWQFDPQAEQRNAAELHGTIRATEGVESGVLILRDPLLADVSVPVGVKREDAASSSPWGGLSGALVFYRETALGIIIEHHPRQGNAALTILPLARVVDLAAGGDRDCQLVAAALGLPSPGELSIVRQRRGWDTSNAPGPPRFHGVPNRNTLFVGREAELSELHQRFTQARYQALIPYAAAVGLGGVGKTELAVEYCYRFREAYRYVWWVSAASRSILVEQLSSFAASLSIPVSGIAAELLMTYVREWLENNDEPWLLVFDNADDPAVLHGAVPVNGLGHVLVTSRFIDWVPRGIRPLPIEPLPVVQSAQLLARRSGREESSEAAALGEQLGGLPLALYQAGAFIKHSGWSFAQYSASLESRAEELLADNSADLYRPTGESLTTISVWDRSLEAAAQRAAAAQSVMEILSCYEAEAIPRWLLVDQFFSTGEIGVEKALAALAQFSLITYSNHHISLHRLVQEAIRSRMMMLGGVTAVGRSLELACQMLDHAFPEDPDDTDLWSTSAQLAGHCSRVTDVAIRFDWTEPVLAAVAARTAQYLNSRGSREEGLGLLDKAARVVASCDDANLQARLLSTRARIERNLGRTEDAERNARTAVALSVGQSGGSRHDALEILGRVLLDKGEVEASKETLRAALRAAREGSAGTRAEVIALNYLARAHTYAGELDDARRMLMAALDLDRSLHSSEHADTAWTLDNLGLVELASNNLVAAEKNFRSALEIESAVHGPEHPRSGWSLRNLAQTLVQQGNPVAAILYFERSLEVIEHATPDNTKEISASLKGLATAESLRGNTTAAESHIRRLGELKN